VTQGKNYSYYLFFIVIISIMVTIQVFASHQLFPFELPLLQLTHIKRLRLYEKWLLQLIILMSIDEEEEIDKFDCNAEEAEEEEEPKLRISRRDFLKLLGTGMVVLTFDGFSGLFNTVSHAQSPSSSPATYSNVSLDQTGNIKMTSFDVKKHGYNFPNYWTGDILLDIPLIGRVDVGDTSYGLCGGMSVSALDTFLANVEVPDQSNTTSGLPSGTEMRSYIYQRQQDTFKHDNGVMIRTLASWIPRPIRTTLGVTGLHVLTDRNFKQKIAPRIDLGKPVPHCIV
jgi:hypothetical protein